MIPAPTAEVKAGRMLTIRLPPYTLFSHSPGKVTLCLMRRPRCPFCERPVGRLWLRCRVCRSRLAPWYVLTLIITLAALSLVGLFIFRETSGHFPF
jgi:hypothetical protein